ncbi:hypothetical protein JQ580_29865 [Bradyrhizobium japonicum]|uniref:hypothetical protein n=1 Tax=Bradyrhizobium japonicum TaxID=375 RepID=UPI001BA744F4|nr:hypothetical protein [Bradyrhizobium japonicum]MBR0994923.1 hypothetical protein [Bradyrhizobium japonicum]
MPKHKSIRHQSATPLLDSIRSSSASVIRYRAADIAPASATELDVRRYCAIPYVDCYHYFDSAYFLSKTLLGAEDQRWLKDHCEHFDILWNGQLFFDERRRRWREVRVYPPYRFRFEAHLPDDEAREFLAHLAMNGERKLIAAHAARDFTFDHRNSAKGEMLDFIDEHWVQPHQRKDRPALRFDNGSIGNGGGSTGRRGKGHYYTYYASEPCRIDGIVDCFHIEGRHQGKQALAKIGILSPLDLLNFDHQSYWQKADQANLKEIDIQRLGQYHSNRLRGSRKRPSDRHRRIGGVLIRKFGLDQFGNLCLQQFIQRYGRGPFLRNVYEKEVSDRKMQMIGMISRSKTDEP